MNACNEWLTRKIAVIGLGNSGVAAIEVLTTLGAQVTGYDSSQERVDSVASEYPKCQFRAISEPHSMARAVFEMKPNIVVMSPGIPAHHPLYRKVPEGIEIWSEIELAWQVQQSVGNRDCEWLTITGTNGKTTTVGLTENILKTSGEKAIAIGNVGNPAVLAAASGQYSVFGVELSSFQLYSTHSVRPQASVCLNVAEDHLDWHGSPQEYAKAKARVYLNTKTAAIYNQSQPQTLQMVLDADVQEGCRAIGITTGVPDIYQIGLVEDLIVDRAYCATPRKEAEYLACLEDIKAFTGPSIPPTILEDVLAAAALTRAHGVDAEAIAEGIKTFRPAPHRRAFVAEKMDVSWIDDSKATNAHAALASLSGCASRSVVWIAGGDGKGQDFNDLVKAVEPVLRGVVLIGVDREPLKQALKANAPSVPITELEPHDELMTSVVHEAVALSLPGDQVILAPACASWDQFDNYHQRGHLFVEAVNCLGAA